MHLNGTYTFNAPRQQVWDTIQNPNVIATCMPGCERFETVGEDRHEATMKIAVGPIKGTFSGKIYLHDRTQPESYFMDVEGGGGPGHVKGGGRLDLREEGARTVVSYDGDAHVTGKIAAVGQRLLGVSAKQMINQFFKCMERRLENGA
jgi:carbon monoxide dehydrogenase subunit G